MSIIMQYMEAFKRRNNVTKYTSELKAKALKSIEDYGVAKTAEAMKISSQALYKWRNVAKFDDKKLEVNTSVTSAKALLESDRLLQEKIIQLEAENNALRTTLIKYRAVLAAVLCEGNA